MTTTTNNINNLANAIKNLDLEILAPNYNKKALSEEQINKIIDRVANDIEVSKEQALAGTMLLMLKGAASDGTPGTLSVDLKDGKTIAKQNVLGAYIAVTGNTYLRRLAESLAERIGEFAEHFKLSGELAQRVNTRLKAETGETLTAKEMAWCSSFSQNIPDLAGRSSERLVKLLAMDYKTRFEAKKNKTGKKEKIQQKKKKGKK